MLQFLKSRQFLVQLFIYAIVVFIIAWGVTFWMSSYTHHGETVTVPNFKGVKITSLDGFVQGKNVHYEITDSIYDPKAAKGVVVRQEPEANAAVKDGRIVYLYVTSILPPRIAMPKLIDRSLRQATAMIASYGLKLGKTEYIPNPCTNCILDQLVKGKSISPGAFIPKGTIIDLIIGKGLGDIDMEVPCLYELSRTEATAKLMELSLNIGIVTYDNIKDSAKSVVYKQTPSCDKNLIRLGASVDLYLTTIKSKIPKKEE
ncbi:MAG: PASTA domain-containing protein [Bacteroidia bacterium]